MTDDQFIKLLDGFHRQRLSEEELRSFLSASEDPRFESMIGEQLHNELVQMRASSLAEGPRADKIWKNIHAAVSTAPNPARRIHFLRTAWVRYAAAVIILFAAGAYLWTSDKRQQQVMALNTWLIFLMYCDLFEIFAYHGNGPP